MPVLSSSLRDEAYFIKFSSVNKFKILIYK